MRMTLFASLFLTLFNFSALAFDRNAVNLAEVVPACSNEYANCSIWTNYLENEGSVYFVLRQTSGQYEVLHFVKYDDQRQQMVWTTRFVSYAWDSGRDYDIESIQIEQDGTIHLSLKLKREDQTPTQVEYVFQDSDGRIKINFAEELIDGTASLKSCFQSVRP